MNPTRHLAVLAAFACLFTFSAAADDVPTRFDNHKLVEVRLDTPLDLVRMLAISEDHWSCSPQLGLVPFRVLPERMDALKASRIPFRVLCDDVQVLLDAERAALAQPRGGWFTTYHPYDEVSAYIDELVALRPDLAARFTTGTSLQNRDIFGIRITGPDGPAGKPAVLFNGCQHAREWVAVAVPMYIADRLIREYDTDPYIRAVLASTVVYVVPIVNPDGYVYTWTNNRLWRKNRRDNGDGTFGVDTNRNWSVGWGLNSGSSGTPSSETYRGTAPFSEPEPSRIRDFILAHPEIEAHIDFHSYGQLILSPYGYFAGEPAEPDRTTFNTLNVRMRDAIFNFSGQNYTYGPISTTLYLASGGAVDWAYDAGDTLSWTIELRPIDPGIGFVLPPDQIIPTAEENWEAVSVLFDYVSFPISITFPAGIPATVDADAPTSIPVAIVNNTGLYQTGTARQFVRIGTTGAFTESALAPAGGSSFTLTLPRATCGQTIQFYVEAQSTLAEIVRAPFDAPTTTYAAAAVQTTVVFADDMETDLGWSGGVTGDTATTGQWVRVNPNGTAAQPEDDHTPAPGVTAWVTGQGAVGGGVGTADVDGGFTTLRSPVISLDADLADPYVSYWRWYSNNQGAAPNADVFTVQIQVNGGAYANLEVVGPAGVEAGGGWFFHQARLLDLVPSLPATVRFQFIADDAAAGSIVEAAVDDFSITDVGCPSSPPCTGDVNDDGVRDLADLATLLASFGSVTGDPGYNPAADFDASGAVDLGDLTVLLSTFGVACP
ncbi:MAG: hypothetical protein IT450_20230 [Phycisphaerales bacterium]|nr:hypothetical protein [Phycisphaerales bacterium]